MAVYKYPTPNIIIPSSIIMTSNANKHNISYAIITESIHHLQLCLKTQYQQIS
jgi:hypothetical protein